MDIKSNETFKEEPRFEFGRNWSHFLATVDEQTIRAAVESLRAMLRCERLDGFRFLDIGCGSGLSSLAARRLGATVHSFDFDPDSVACTQELKQRYFAGDDKWRIDRGSALDRYYVRSLGLFDVVYSWGVLHHTGHMDAGLELAAKCVRPEGRLFIAIYNDQGHSSRRWTKIKQVYHQLPRGLRWIWVVLVAGLYECKFAVVRLIRGRNPLPFADWRQKRNDRGMSVWHDWVDWIGGWPFEYATPDHIINKMSDHGFLLSRIKTVGRGWGCNEYVFVRGEDAFASEAARSSR